MGEIFVISEESMEEEEGEEEMEVEMEMRVVKDKEGFLPRMDIRVLLVEADDCTRRIIAALLRKCGYRVTAVSNASKAWGMLKERPQDIDLVLTEVESPSISGLSLLAMMMEHKICKNIPVIMMSSNDSIGVVYKCMLRGAVDFLVKPVRKNELRILWQHVWRRQSSSSSGQGLQDGIAAQQKNGASSENNAASNHSSNFFGNSQSNKQCSDKESDAQSSCTKRDMEAESPYVQSTQGFLKPKSRSSPLASDTKLRNDDECVKSDDRMPLDEREEEQQPTGKKITQHKDAIEETQVDDDHIPCETMESNCKKIELPREAIDLMGSFDEHRQACRADVQEVTCNDSKIHSGLYDIRNESSSGPVLELSLMQYNQSGYGNQKTDEICTMSHSNLSPFSQYNNRILQPRLPMLVNAQTKPKEFADKSDQHNITQDLSMLPQAIGRSSQAATAIPFPQLGVLPLPDPSSQKTSGYGSVLPPMFYTQSCAPSSWNPSSDHQQESPFFLASSQWSKPAAHNVEQGCDQDIDNCTNQTVHQQQKQNLDDMETPMHVSTSTSQSGTSSLCNEEGLLVHDGTRGTDPHRSLQRELALTKFRLKRKDRCFEKKVRYQSRKRLAEQRPRVKGQFVRQIPADLPLTYTNC